MSGVIAAMAQVSGATMVLCVRAIGARALGCGKNYRGSDGGAWMKQFER
jgi:hypothetical protein